MFGVAKDIERLEKRIEGLENGAGHLADLRSFDDRRITEHSTRILSANHRVEACERHLIEIVSRLARLEESLQVGSPPPDCKDWSWHACTVLETCGLDLTALDSHHCDDQNSHRPHVGLLVPPAESTDKPMFAICPGRKDD